jgi:hypothetical protein
MILKEILEDVLPTKWSRWTAVLTAASSITVLPLPYLWPFSVLIKTDTERQIFQALLLVSTFLIGTLICLLLVVIDYHKQAKKSLMKSINSKIHPYLLLKSMSTLMLLKTIKHRGTHNKSIQPSRNKRLLLLLLLYAPG